jgi:hypothetical protein
VEIFTRQGARRLLCLHVILFSFLIISVFSQKFQTSLQLSPIFWISVWLFFPEVDGSRLGINLLGFKTVLLCPFLCLFCALLPRERSNIYFIYLFICYETNAKGTFSTTVGFCALFVGFFLYCKTVSSSSFYFTYY